MPEFILNDTMKPSRAKPEETTYSGFMEDFAAFERGYIEAVFFTNGDTGNEEREDHLNELGTARLTRMARANIKGTCARFIARMGTIGVDVKDFDEEQQKQAGRDFWFTRQGHGTGFWDRDADTYGTEEARDLLDQHARHVGESYVEVARGWIYVR